MDRRVRRVDPNPNPLFTQWIQQFREEAVAKQNLNLVRIFDRCMDSLEKYPLSLASGKHCMILQGFGKNICSRLDKKLEEHSSRNLEENFPISPLRSIENIQNKDLPSNHNKGNENHKIVNADNIADDLADNLPDNLPDKDDYLTGSGYDEDVSEFHTDYRKFTMRREKSIKADLIFNPSDSDTQDDVSQHRVKRKYQDDLEDLSPRKKVLDYATNSSHNQEEEDFRYALMLSQREEQDLNISQQSVKSQEDEDMLIAKQLQDELDAEARELRHKIGIETPTKVNNQNNLLGLSENEYELPSPTKNFVPKNSYNSGQIRNNKSQSPTTLDGQLRYNKSPSTSTSDCQLRYNKSPSPEISDGQLRNNQSPSLETSDGEFRYKKSPTPDSQLQQSKPPSLSTAPMYDNEDIETDSVNNSFLSPPTQNNRISVIVRRASPVVIIDSDNDSDTGAINDAAKINDDSCVPGFSLHTPELLSREQSYVSLVERRDFNDSNVSNRGMSSGTNQLKSQHSALIQNISDVLEGKGKGRGKGSSRGGGRGRGRGGGKSRDKSRTEDDTSLQDDSMYPGDESVNRSGRGSRGKAGGSGGKGGGSGGKPGRKGKEYVPKTRSGGYALLIALHKVYQREDYIGYICKDDLIREAQPLSDQSFALKSNHSEFYTAWSSMSTLVKRDLVKRWSNPAKFTITDQGLELANRILAVENGTELPVRSQAPQENNILDNNSSKNQSKSSAQSTAASKAASAALARAEKSASIAKSATATKSAITAAKLATAASTSSAVTSAYEPSFDLEDLSFSESFSEATSSTSTSVRAVMDRGPHSGTSLTDLPEEGMHQLMKLQRAFLQASDTSPNQGSYEPEFTLSRGQFDVLLCVDNTETTGGGAGGRKTLKVETIRHLESCGVAYNTRNLSVGDFLWIARERVTHAQTGQYAQRTPRELVLPYIVERKRLDDLWASVKDGRYEEQKFRMKSSGLHRLYYLIEDYGKQKQYWAVQAAGGQTGRPVTTESINQAQSNTAVQEGFSIIHTNDQKGSIEFLTLFTRILQKKYSPLTLRSCTQADLSNGVVRDRDTSLLTFNELNSSSRKNRKMTLKEIFAKMLLKLKGLSVEMAQGIVDEYQTPQQFREALISCGTETAGIQLLQEISIGLQSKRKIPRNIAEGLVHFWTRNNINN